MFAEDYANVQEFLDACAKHKENGAYLDFSNCEHKRSMWLLCCELHREYLAEEQVLLYWAYYFHEKMHLPSLRNIDTSYHKSDGTKPSVMSPNWYMDIAAASGAFVPSILTEWHAGPDRKKKIK